MHAQGFIWHVWFWPPQGPSFFGTPYADLYVRAIFWMVPTTTLFSSKMKKGLGHGGIRCSCLHIKMAPQKRHPSGRRQFSTVAFFSLKKHRIDGFPPLFSPEKKNRTRVPTCQNGVANVIIAGTMPL